MRSRALVALLFIAMLSSDAAAQLRPALAGSYASAENAATSYFNPAGMTRLEGRELVFDTILAYSRSQFEVSSGTTTSGGDSDLQQNFISVPSIYFAMPVYEDRVWMGASLNVPSGIGADYGGDWAGRYVSTESSLFYLAINSAVAIRITDWLSIGGGLEILYTQSESKSKINNIGEGLPDGEVKLELSGIGVGGNVSVLLEYDERNRFGISYRPKTETDIDGVPEIEGAGPLLRASLAASDLLNKKIEVSSTSPQRVAIGFYSEPMDRLSLTADFMWIDMEQFGSVDVSIDDLSTSVDGDWQDTFLVSLSAGWELTDRLELLAGFSYLSPPIKDSKRTLSLPVGRIFIGGVGARWEFMDWLDGHLSFNYFDLGDASVDTEPTLRSGRIKGKFSPNYALAFDVGLTARF